MTAVDTAVSWLRCPRSSCEDYGKRLMLDVGQGSDSGALTVRHYCLSCTYAETGPRTPKAARRSSVLAELLRKQRLQGMAIPLVIDQAPWPEVEV